MSKTAGRRRAAARSGRLVWRDHEDPALQFAVFAICAEGFIHNATADWVVCAHCREVGDFSDRARPGHFPTMVIYRNKRERAA